MGDTTVVPAALGPDDQPASAARRFLPWIIVPVLLAVAAFGTSALLNRRFASVPPTHTVQPGEPQVNLLALGDWGGQTSARQRVADSMAQYARDRGHPFNAALLVGDNFYKPLTGVDDPQWKQLFEEGFNAQDLNFPFYAILGNHDYTDDSEIHQLQYPQLHPDSRWKMPARWYRLDLPADKPLVTLFMLDSNRHDLSPEDFATQRLWLETELAKPRHTAWTVVCAHHPLFSSGKHASNPRLEQQWGDLLRLHKVDLYIAGHDHHMEHLTRPDYPTHFIITGGGGKSTREIAHDANSTFAGETYGFTHLRFSEHSADILFLDDLARPIHAFSLTPRSLAVSR